MVKFISRRFPEAKQQGLAGPWGADNWDEVDVDYEDWYTSGIWMLDTDGSHFIAADGGEPEDQTLSRNWSWVPDALQQAYDQGFHDGVGGSHA